LRRDGTSKMRRKRLKAEVGAGPACEKRKIPTTLRAPTLPCGRASAPGHGEAAIRL
jgi:hypothetical protein